MRNVSCSKTNSIIRIKQTLFVFYIVSFAPEPFWVCLCSAEEDIRENKW